MIELLLAPAALIFLAARWLMARALGVAWWRPDRRRALVAIAGPVGCVLAAMLLAIGVFVVVGVERVPPSVTIDGVVREGPHARIAEVVAGSPAERGGLRVDDEIVSVDGRRMEDSSDVGRWMRAAGERDVSLAIERDGAAMTIALRPAAGRIGVGLEPATVQVHDAGTALSAGMKLPFTVLAFEAASVRDMLVGRTKAELAGPVGIVRVVKDARPAHRAEVLLMIAVQTLWLAAILGGLLSLVLLFLPRTRQVA